MIYSLKSIALSSESPNFVKLMEHCLTYSSIFLDNFQSVPKKLRKVTIESRFQRMFDEDQFKVQCKSSSAMWTGDAHSFNIYIYTDKVDKRGRKVKQSSSENLRKYYQLEGGRGGFVSACYSANEWGCLFYYRGGKQEE